MNDSSLKSEILDSEPQKNTEDVKDEEIEYLEYMARLGQVKKESQYPELTIQNIKKGHSFVSLSCTYFNI